MPFDPIKAATELANNAADTAKDLASRAGDAAQAAGETAQSTVRDVADKAAQAASAGAQAVQGAASKAQHDIDVRRFSPLFLEAFDDPSYVKPKMIVLEDPSPRKDIEVCKGSIGWTSREGALDVLHLYDTAVDESKLGFYPSPICYGIYYIDPLNPSRYISLSKFFDIMQQNQMNELHNIAYALGAKHCKLEIIEEEKMIRSADAKLKIAGKDIPVPNVIPMGKDQTIELNGNIDPSIRHEKNAVRRVKFDEEFAGSAELRRPELHWYANDNTINSLIEKRLGDGNTLTKYSLLLDYKTSDFINAGMATAIDVALKKMRVNANCNVMGEYQKENRTKMELLIEF